MGKIEQIEQIELPEVIITVKDNIQVIKLNRPRKKNSFTGTMYKTVTKCLNEAAFDDDILITVITGEGDFYSSGTDLTDYDGDQSIDDYVAHAKNTLLAFVDSFINFPKILVAIVNGPAVGIAATTLALFDVVYATDKAYIQTPFTKLGLSPEGCSTYTFPKLFGPQRASEMLLLGHKMPITDAVHYGLITQLYSGDEMLEDIWNKIRNMSELPKQSLLQSKRLMKMFDKDSLTLANVRECEELEHRWKSEEFLAVIMKFMSKHSKL